MNPEEGFSAASDSMEQNQMDPEQNLKRPITKKNIKRLLSYLTDKYKVLLGIVLLCIIAHGVASAYCDFFIRDLMDIHVTGAVDCAKEFGIGAVDYSPLAVQLGKMAVIFGLAVLAEFCQGFIMMVISNNVMRDIRDDMFKHMQTLPVSYFDTHQHGDVMSHYSNDVDVLRQLFDTLPTVVTTIITIIKSLVVMVLMSWQLAIPVVAGTVGMTFLMGRVGGRCADLFGRQQESLGDVDGYIEELVNGEKVVKSFTYEDRARKTFDQKNDELCELSTKANILSGIIMPLMNSIGSILYVLVAFIGAFLVLKCGVTAITLGVIAAFLPMTQQFVAPVAGISEQMRMCLMAFAGADRVFELIDETPEVDDGYVTLVHCRKDGDELIEVTENMALVHKYDEDYVMAWKHPHGDGTVTYTELQGDVRLFDVDFSYDGKKQVLYDISLYAEPGEKIAFVGATGAGKTTITNLINRFYDIADGKIRYDDININKIKKADLRHSLGMVLQDTHLFTGTVMENIRYGNLQATDKECIEAAKLANAHDFISKLPKGYDTELTANGSELSQGQCQLIAIARAAVADPPVMILDEATSSIDTRTEAIVQKGMEALMNNRTVFVIAHRLSTVKNSEAIMVMENGKIIERGDHETLIADKGTYYRLYTGAFELE